MPKKTIRVLLFLFAITVILVATHAMAAPSRVFVTSTIHPGGNFGGLSGADSVCNRLAAAAGLGGTYTAWLSDDATDAADRVYHNPDGYITTNGDMVANDWAALINAETVDLLHTINYDENGNDIGTVQPWTGTYENGQATADNCLNWTDSTSDYRGTTGLTNDTNIYWSEYTDDRCDNSYPFYCFENQILPPTSVPTMNEWGMIILSMILTALAFYFICRRIRTS